MIIRSVSSEIRVFWFSTYYLHCSHITHKNPTDQFPCLKNAIKIDYLLQMKIEHRCSQTQFIALWGPDAKMLSVVPGKELGGSPLTAGGERCPYKQLAANKCQMQFLL